MKSMKHSQSLFRICALFSLCISARSQTQRVIVDLNVTPGTESARVTRFYGPTAGAELGADFSHGIVPGDFNADGFQDLFIGAPRALASPNRTNAGEGIVIFGPLPPQQSPIDLSSAPSIQKTVFLANRAGDRLGFGATAGDFDGDGVDDLAIGAYLGTPPRDGAGIVYVFSGGCDFPLGTVDLSLPQSLTGVTRIIGRYANYQLGSSMVSGDFNGDGYGDLLMGAKTAPRGSDLWYGEAVIVYGGPHFFGSYVDTLAATPELPISRILGRNQDDFTGISVASGDLNGDGFDDAVVGASASAPTISKPGLAYIFYGGPTFGETVLDMALPTGTFGETRIIGGTGAIGVGISVATGDIDLDGFNDLVLGALSGRGTIFVLFGSPGKMGTVALNGSQLDLASPGSARLAKITGRATQDRLGYSLGVSDLDGDGKPEVICGAYASDGSGFANSGSVSVVSGSRLSSGQTIALQSVEENILVTGDNAQDKLGTGVEGGFDLDGDGASDISFAATNFDGPVGANAGAAYVVYGSNDSQSTGARQWFPAGMAYQRGMGGRMSPVIRSWVGFLSGPLSDCTVTIMRNKLAIVGLGNLAEVLPVYWTVETSRTDAMLTFKYTDAELGLLDEEQISLFQAPAPSGPWVRVEPQVLNSEANLVHCIAHTEGVFALATTTLDPVVCGPMDALNGLGIPRLSTQN